MVVECTINVGFHSNFGTLMRSGHSKNSPRLTIIDGLPFNPTYDPQENHHKLSPDFFLVKS